MSSIGEMYGELRMDNFAVFLTCQGSVFRLQSKEGSFVHLDREISSETMDYFDIRRHAAAAFRKACREALERHAERQNEYAARAAAAKK